MIPMAIPTFGGMLFGIVTVFVVPVLYCSLEEFRLRFRRQERDPASKAPSVDP
jgi:Cu(I)/Ag(I) efflux system membrane protein CusA/SilA